MMLKYGDGLTRSLVLDFFSLPVSDIQELADWLGVERIDPFERDLDFGKRILEEARTSGNIGEFTSRVTLALHTRPLYSLDN